VGASDSVAWVPRPTAYLNVMPPRRTPTRRRRTSSGRMALSNGLALGDDKPTARLKRIYPLSAGSDCDTRNSGKTWSGREPGGKRTGRKAADPTGMRTGYGPGRREQWMGREVGGTLFRHSAPPAATGARTLSIARATSSTTST